ncbi:hypothetical protein FHU38_001151 [Saccharomonospora amisosensis]|uniref:Uncharacterized protein n=1 Tax=Saccharomonospora amisosensis TaxID=1128677 RepID=A0A7X5UN62_9PSEU|nr:hypothetical protein [Saccharomonospora amisosensis]
MATHPGLLIAETSQGFTPTERFEVDGWLGQVFEDRLG